MKRIAVGLVAMTLLGSLAACGSSGPTDAAPNGALADQSVLNEVLPADENALATDDGLGNGTADDMPEPAGTAG